MTAVDVSRVTAERDDPTLEVMLARLETRGLQPRIMRQTSQPLREVGRRLERSFAWLIADNGAADYEVYR